MKRLFVITAWLVFDVAHPIHAEGPDAQYVKIYNLIAEGDQSVITGQPDAAREKYLQARDELRKLQNSSPKWQEKVVQFRLEYVGEKLKAFGLGQAAPASGGKPETHVVQPSANEKDRQIQTLSMEVHQLKQEKTVLESKLQEALSARPAAIDPRELARAEERIKLLEKEKELLKVSLEQERTKPGKQADAQMVDDLKKALADASKKLSEQSERVVQLVREKEILETRLQSAQKEAEAAKTQRAGHEELRKQLADSAKLAVDVGAKSSQPQKDSGVTPGTVRNYEVEILRLQSDLKTLQLEKAILESAKKDLETKLTSLTSSGPRPVSVEHERLRQVEKERDDLVKKLNETSRQLYDNKARTESVRKEQFDNELAILRARLEVFEARAIPFTPAEKALFEKPQSMVAKADPKSGKKSLRELPRGAAPLVAEAERAFAARRYDEAERKYSEALRLDEKNALTLANLAACQLEQNRLEEAETNLKRALQSEADDAQALSLLGILRFRQEKFDEALDLLGRSAQLDSQDAQTQNYLGITLSQKGHRVPAETALRKAIQLAPGYGGAHHNLAVIYATQQPPFIELARWHYQKALASGHQANAELERLIEGKGAASETK
ncbi:MAG: tetratricopeptide repeat protein [Verrucomicrobia bacterium]|nr:tetratricopeptide repeat protein [Verrucomicrobiota bacterium]